MPTHFGSTAAASYSFDPKETAETKASFVITLKKKDRWERRQDGVPIIVEESETREVTKDFRINFRVLFSDENLKQYVVRMLSSMGFPPEICQQLKQRISSFARDSANKTVKEKCNNLKISLRIDVVIVHTYIQEEEDLDRVLRESMYDDGRRGFGGVPATRSSIDALETTEFNSGEAVTCAICLDEFSIGMEIKRMPCYHAFHGGCIVSWLEQSNKCPLCRFQMPN